MEALGRCRILGMLGDRLTALSGARQRPRMEKPDTDFITTVIRLSTADRPKPAIWLVLVNQAFPHTTVHGTYCHLDRPLNVLGLRATHRRAVGHIQT